MWPISLEEEEQMGEDIATCQLDAQSHEGVTCVRAVTGKVETWQCADDEDEDVCCNPSMREALLADCLTRKCPSVESAQLCDDKGYCTAGCKVNCCCAWPTTIKAFLSVWNLGSTLVRFLLNLVTPNIEGSLTPPDEDGSNSTNSTNQTTADKIGEDTKAFATGTTEDVLLLWGCFLLWGLAVSIGLDKIRRRLARLASLTAELTTKQVTALNNAFINSEKSRAGITTQKMKVEDEDSFKVDEYITGKDEEGLGGIQQKLITEVAGVSNFKWMKTNLLCLGMFTILIRGTKDVNVCLLGKTGRLLVVTRKPLYPAKEASIMLSSVGVTYWLVMTLFLVWVRILEFQGVMIRKYGTDEAKANYGSTTESLEGRTFIISLGFSALSWFLILTNLKVKVKDFGNNDVKNYYESNTAVCTQYFRTGERGMPFMSPQRNGGLRMFFELYPVKELWSQLGKGYKFLQCLEPIIKLPSEVSSTNGMPPAGTGEPDNVDDRAAYLTKLLALLNTFLSIAGIIVFGINLFNLITNMSKCPLAATMKDCVEGERCVVVGKSPWFSWWLVSEGYFDRGSVQIEVQSSAASIDEIGRWINSETVGQTKRMIVDAAKTVCAQWDRDLFIASNATYYGLVTHLLGQDHAYRFLQSSDKPENRIVWNADTLNCDQCIKNVAYYYFSDYENLLEIISICGLVTAGYVGSVIAGYLTNTTKDIPMIDLQFAQEPGIAASFKVEQVEVECLAMTAATFFYRYQDTGLPENLARTEKELRNSQASDQVLGGAEQAAKERAAQADPWEWDTTSATWDDYMLYLPDKPFTLRVSRKLLGLLEGEEVVAGWTVPVLLSKEDKFFMAVSSAIFVLGPAIFGFFRSKTCLVELLVGLWIEYTLYTAFIKWRRPQSGILITTRRIFQLTKTPRYMTFAGKTEPLIKVDVLLHNCQISYGALQMETFVPATRRLLARIMGWPVTRQGQVIAQGACGIFKLWRRRGDTYQMMKHVSRISSAKPQSSVDPRLGASFMLQEKVEGVSEPKDPPCSCCCCPFTPAPVGIGEPGQKLVDRYLKRKKGEKDVYGRVLAVRPTTCKDLCCGRGCFRCACECCPCCMLDEMSTEFMITTHRLLVEQRVAHRYGRRCSACCRKTPNLRTTFLSHDQADAYVIETPLRNVSMSKLASDFSLKILQKYTREYQQGLMLHQKPYQVFGRATPKPELWVGHLNAIFDSVTQKPEEVEDSGSDVDTEEEEFLDLQYAGEFLDGVAEEAEEAFGEAVAGAADAVQHAAADVKEEWGNR